MISVEYALLTSSPWFALIRLGASFKRRVPRMTPFAMAPTKRRVIRETSGAGLVSWACRSNIRTGAGDTINATGVYTNRPSRYSFQQYMSVTYAMCGAAGVGDAYQSIGLAGLSNSVFVTGV